MPWGVAVAAIGAYSSYAAADKASDATKKGIKKSSELASRAREDAIQLFQSAAVDGRKGITGAFDFYRNNIARRYQPFMQGNQAAQNVIGQGAQQANNAILGLPVDMSFTQQQQPQVDTSFIGQAQLPEYGPPKEEEPVMGPEEQNPNMIGAQPKKKESTTDKLWKYDPHNVMIKKPVDSLKKKLKKIF